MRAISFCFIFFLTGMSSLWAQQVVDFGQVVVGHDSVINADWWPPDETGTLQLNTPSPPFYLLEYHTDSTGGWHWHFELRFHPDTVGRFAAAVLAVRDANGNPTPYGLVVRGEGVISAATDPIIPHPSSFSLSAFPNPFNPQTEITFSLPRAGRATIKAFNLLGQQVSVLQDGILTSGEHRVLFDGGQLPAGIYFLRLEAASHQRTLKLVLLK